MDTKKSKILIVDDEATNIKLLRRVLEVGQFEQIFSTQDPTSVCDMHEKNCFQLIILDLNMPIMNGFDVLDKIKHDFPDDCPAILVLTAQSMPEHRHRALTMGANDYLTKPFDQIEILARVENMITVKISQELLKDQNVILEEQVKKRTAELEKVNDELYISHLQVVKKLGLAAEYRDNETGFHIMRMSEISALIGKKSGMSTHEVEMLLNASPMHDIGKIGIPDNILLKAGKLTSQEWEIMKTHATIGGDILASSDCELLIMAHTIAITHHEKFDGSGYPAGLVGEEIPFVGRICALADVFDALTSVRPYKKAWSLKETISYIKEHSGAQFDPKLVELFLDNIKEILIIKDRYSEEGDINFSEQYQDDFL